jgi:hypothetical protein
VSRLKAYLPLKESWWHIVIGKYVSETCFQKFSKTYPKIVGLSEGGTTEYSGTPVNKEYYKA